MPESFLRVLAAVLFALVIPVQGMASVVAGQCMAYGHHQDAGGQDHERHSHDDGSDAHDHGAPDKHADDEQSAHCGPCTACCASASMAAPAAASVIAAPSHVAYPFSQLEPPDAEPHRFDRPPLSL